MKINFEKEKDKMIFDFEQEIKNYKLYLNLKILLVFK
jgi:hypothetical protein